MLKTRLKNDFGLFHKNPVVVFFHVCLFAILVRALKHFKYQQTPLVTIWLMIKGPPTCKILKAFDLWGYFKVRIDLHNFYSNLLKAVARKVTLTLAGSS